jgi:hypothetical protein
MEGKNFIYSKVGDTIYNIKLKNYKIVKQHDNKIYAPVKITRDGVLSEKYLDFGLEDGNCIFPDMNKKTIVSVMHVSGDTTHRIYGTSLEAVIDAANEAIKTKVSDIRDKIEQLKEEEIIAIGTIGELLIEKSKCQSVMTTEEFVTMAL